MLSVFLALTLSLQPIAASPVSFPSSSQVSAQVQGTQSLPQTPRRTRLPYCASNLPVAPNYIGGVDLINANGLSRCNAGSSVAPWSGAFSPDGNSVYISMFGGNIGAGSCIVGKFDAQTMTLQKTITVGESPEDIVLTTSAPGVLRLGFVTNSSESSVSVWNSADQVVATIPIPLGPNDGGFGTAFPFGMAVSPDQSRVYVGTGGGSGWVHVINTQTLSLIPSERLSFGPEHGVGRLKFAGPTLVVPITEMHPNFQGSTAKLAFLDPQQPAAQTVLTLDSSPNTTAFPSPIEVGVWCGTTVFVAGFDMGPRVFVFDAPSRSHIQDLAVPTSNLKGKYQALGVSSQGLLAVADFFTSEVAFFDAISLGELGLVDLGTVPEFHTQMNDFIMDAEGERMILTGQFSDSLALFETP